MNMENKDIAVVEFDTVKAVKIASVAIACIGAACSGNASMTSRAIITLVGASEVKRILKKDNLEGKSHITEATGSVIAVATIGVLVNKLFGN